MLQCVHGAEATLNDNHQNNTQLIEQKRYCCLKIVLNWPRFFLCCFEQKNRLMHNTNNSCRWFGIVSLWIESKSDAANPMDVSQLPFKYRIAKARTYHQLCQSCWTYCLPYVSSSSFDSLCSLRRVCVRRVPRKRTTKPTRERERKRFLIDIVNSRPCKTLCYSSFNCLNYFFFYFFSFSSSSSLLSPQSFSSHNSQCMSLALA